MLPVIIQGIVLAMLVVGTIWDLRYRIVPPAVSHFLLILGGLRCLAAGNIPALIAMGIAFWDFRKWWASALAIISGGLFSLWAVEEEYIAVPLLILGVYVMWMRGWIGGGDGKLMIALFSLFPGRMMLMSFLAGWILFGLGVMLWKYRRGVISALVLSWRGDLQPQEAPGTIGILLGYLLFLIAYYAGK